MTQKAPKIIGLKEFRENTETYIRRIHKGESITVVRRSLPIFKLTPVDDEETGWETVVDFTKLNPRGVSGRTVLASLKEMNG